MANPLVMDGGLFQQGNLPWWMTFQSGQNPDDGSIQYSLFDKNNGQRVTQDASGNFSYADGSAPSYASAPAAAQVLGSGGQGLMQVRLADGTVTNATELNGDAGDYSKLFGGLVPGAGYAQVQGQGAPQTQVVRGSDGNLYAALPRDAKVYAPKPDDTGFGELLMRDFAPIAMAALPFSGLGSTLSGALGGGALGNAGAGAILNAGTSLLTGGDPITGAIKGGAGALINPALDNAGVPSAVAPFVTNAAISAATGGDVGQSLLNTAVNSGVRGLGGLFGSSPQKSYQYTMSGGDAPSSVSVQNLPADSGANMDIYGNSGGWTPDYSTNSVESLWPTSGFVQSPSPVAGTPADNYMNFGNLYDYGGNAPIGGTYNFNTGGYDAGTPTPTADPGVLGYIKQALGIGAAAGAGGGQSGNANGLLGGIMGGNGGLLLPLLGGLLGGMSGGSKPAGTTTTVNDIPDWQKPYVTNAFTQAGNALTDANAAYAATKPTTDLATNNLNATIRGDYLGSNPALDNMFNTAANQVASKVNSQFSAAGRYGSGAQTSTLTEGLGNLANNIYGQNYQQERQRQFAGSLAAPSYSQGTTQAAYGPASGYANIVRQPVGSTQQSPYFTNPLGGAVSGLLGGYALSRM